MQAEAARAQEESDEMMTILRARVDGEADVHRSDVTELKTSIKQIGTELHALCKHLVPRGDTGSTCTTPTAPRTKKPKTPEQEERASWRLVEDTAEDRTKGVEGKDMAAERLREGV